MFLVHVCIVCFIVSGEGRLVVHKNMCKNSQSEWVYRLRLFSMVRWLFFDSSVTHPSSVLTNSEQKEKRSAHPRGTNPYCHGNKELCCWSISVWWLVSVLVRSGITPAAPLDLTVISTELLDEVIPLIPAS